MWKLQKSSIKELGNTIYYFFFTPFTFDCLEYKFNGWNSVVLLGYKVTYRGYILLNLDP